ncbi:hypothetical protein SODALDRAFT_334489 [Sodiomyces alkalinus F11]|uniref:Uncharacterized protein n=1 Tax=Sodiomyces alkalinus (strain CBS 110278 / VKM F-3762 / F11) TaxID=1314773 RepID=A0A3N2PSU7_SODAK|nr:hypothetical protein SODALDRAFT_334489 [Sodiomyces alkalinus F11]ROT37396.1 hypothetical protein SODALDRAFT_334489 [Sodiomyces alkalinus F11]
MKATTAAIALTALIGAASAKPVEMENKNMMNNAAEKITDMRVAERRSFLSMLMGGDDEEAEEAVPTETVDVYYGQPAPTVSIEARAAEASEAVGGQDTSSPTSNTSWSSLPRPKASLTPETPTLPS